MSDIECAIDRLAEAVTLLTRAAAADGQNMPRYFRAAVTVKNTVDLLAAETGRTGNQLWITAYRNVDTQTR